MAIVQNALIGRTKRSVGNTTFVTLYGQNILKAKAMEVRDAMTATQLAFRAYFALIVMWAKWLNYSLQVKLRYSGNSSLYKSAAFPYIVADFQKARLGVAPNFDVNWNTIRLGSGAMPPTLSFATAMSLATQNATTTWSAELAPQQALFDKLAIVALNYTKQTGYLIDNAGVRGDESLIWQFPEAWALNDEVYVFAMFTSNDNAIWDAPYAHASVIAA
jgi:hypothetical protein